MAKDGIKMRPVNKGKFYDMENGRPNVQSRDSTSKQIHELVIENVLLPYNGSIARKSIKPQHVKRGSFRDSTYNPDRESALVLRDAVEYPRPRTAHGLKHEFDIQEESEIRPRTSAGRPSLDDHFIPKLPTKTKTWNNFSNTSNTSVQRFTLTRTPTQSGNSTRPLIMARSISGPTKLDNPEEAIGIAISTPSTHQTFTRSVSVGTMSVSSRGSQSSMLPQHVVHLESNSSEEQQTYQREYSQPNEPVQRGWKKLFGRGLFNKRNTMKSAPSSNSDTPNVPVYEQSTSFPSIMPTPQIIEPTAMDTESPNKGFNFEDNAHITKSKDEVPLLDVDIPSVEMERYSVMFDSLLKPSTQSPLYMRRKSKDASWMLGQKISENPAATPQLTIKANNRDTMAYGLVNRSPLWVFPATPKTPQTPQTPNRSRAMTLPITPVTIDRLDLNNSEEDVAQKRQSEIVPSLLLMLQSNHSDRAPSPGRFLGPLSPFSILSQDTELDSPIDDSAEDAPWVRKFDFPEELDLQTITTPLRPRTPSPTEMYRTSNHEEELIATAARVSIARQISISQRQLLLPILNNPERFINRPSLSIPPTPSYTVDETTAPTSAVAQIPSRYISGVEPVEGDILIRFDI